VVIQSWFTGGSRESFFPPRKQLERYSKPLKIESLEP
jgi:hypothetical protein